MPTNQKFQKNPRVWAKCLADIRTSMLAAGWIERSSKFSEVKLRKANKLYNSLG